MAKKQNFVMNDEMLKDIIFKQTGSVLKAIEEALQNSLDAEATKICIEINSLGMKISDNGCGMNEDQIDEYFRIFGNSPKKNQKNKIGKFGMGRGQIFAQGLVKWTTQSHKMITNCARKLNYFMVSVPEYVNGTKIICAFYKPLDNWTLERTITGVKDYILPNDVEILINGEVFDLKKELVKNLSDDNFEVFTTELYEKRIFSQNLYVKNYETTTTYNISCKNKMELNFARNSFLENDDSTKQLYDLIARIEKDELLKKKNYDASTGKQVLKFILSGKLDVNDFYGKNLVEMADGVMVSLKDVSNKKVMFAGKTRKADRAIQMGHFVVNDTLQNVLFELKSKEMVAYTRDSREIDEVSPEGFFKTVEEELLYKKYGKKALLNWFVAKDINSELWKSDRELSLGVSDIAEGWTDGYYHIHIAMTMFRNKNSNKGGMIMDIFELLCHEYAHNTDDKNETAHDPNFHKRYNEIVSSKARRIGNYIISSNLKDIEDEYGYEIDNAIEKAKDVKVERKQNLGKTSVKIMKSLKHLNMIMDGKYVSTKEIHEACGVSDSYCSEVLRKLQKQGYVLNKTKNQLDYEPKYKNTNSFWKISDTGKKTIQE